MARFNEVVFLRNFARYTFLIVSSVQTRHLFQIIHLVSYKETFLQGRRLLGSFNESIKNFNVHSLSLKLSKENFGTKKKTQQ